MHFFVRAAGQAHAPAAAFVLIDQHNAVFAAFINRAARTGRHTGRIQAVFAQTWQIGHEGVFEFAVHLFLHIGKVLVSGTFAELRTQIVFPVRAADDFVHTFAGQQRAWTGYGLMFALFRGVQMLVVKIKRLVVIVDFRHMRVGEDFMQQVGFVAHARLQFAVDFADPTTLPFFLIFPVVRIAQTRLGFHVVKPRVLHPFATGPDVFTGYGTGVAANAFVEIQHHADL